MLHSVSQPPNTAFSDCMVLCCKSGERSVYCYYITTLITETALAFVFCHVFALRKKTAKVCVACLL